MEDGQNSLDASAVATALRRGSVPEGLAAKRGYGRGLVVLYVEHGVEFCNLQQVLNSFSQMQQLQLAALVADGCESGDQGLRMLLGGRASALTGLEKQTVTQNARNTSSRIGRKIYLTTAALSRYTPDTQGEAERSC